MLTPKPICDSLSDLEILRRALEALDFFSCLYERYEQRFLRYIRRVSGATAEEAPDILQDAFIKIWKNLNGFDQSLKLSSWMYRIVHNEAVSFLRRKKSFGKDQKVPYDEQLYQRMPDEVQDAAEEPELRDQRTQHLVNRLPQPYKEVLILKYWENLSYEEISDVLKIPEGTVATRINRAKKAFIQASEKTPAP
ncbi:MAG: RNA polymerase sigma factor [Lewinellaceae bacterium]|nr:RNA polymerase sigma factor [Lewinellaceae bacterium]